jgi:DNA repair and recombination RAD54-like protein
MQADEYGIEQEVSVSRPPPLSAFTKEDQYVPPILAKWLRPHQREGVQFMYQCVMNMKNFKGNGCILADDMGLGKTLQSVCLIYTLLKTSLKPNREPTAKRVIVVCPCSLVKNWDNEFIKWLGPGAVKTLALAESDRKTVEKSMDVFVRTKLFNVLICSYETIRTHIKRLNKNMDSCDLLVCDEAHRLKNNENQTSRALASLPVKRRVLLTGTPMQNDLQEFFAMVDFTNPGVLGTQDEFRKNILFPVLRGREPDATEKQKKKMMERQNELASITNEFILRRVNTLNAEHLPPKLVQVVCCNLTDIQKNMYQHLISSKDMQHVLDGKQVNCLSSIQMLMKLCNHPRLVAEEDPRGGGASMGNGRRAASKKSYAEEEKSSAAPGADGVGRFLPLDEGGSGRGMNTPVRPEWSGKMFVLFRIMKEMRKPGINDKIVIVSNYTQTLDLIGRMCRENSWGFCRLDGSVSMKKRQKMVDDFNDPSSSLIAFLLSSKAGGCGLNLIGGNRLVLFDPDWNPAVDKQAAARCWRDGQKKRCFTYRFLATG